ncbi:MAG: DUF4864 domain-containing protein [Actinomycetota bacterium]
MRPRAPEAGTRWPRLPALLLLVVLLAGCGLDDGAVDEALESGGGEPAPGGGAQPPASGCEPVVAEAVDGVLADQLAAFAAQDWEAAWEHASDAFRRSVDAEGLAAIVEEDFPVVAEAASHDVERCEQRGDRVAALVAVVGRSGEQALLAYELVRERGAWAVDGAVTLEGRGEGDLVAAAGSAPARR